MSGTQLVTYQQQWDIDNHLVVVTNTTTGQVTRYFYDADGNRVKRIGPQGTTLYVNADYEVTGPSQMVTPTVTIPPTYTHKLYLAFVACASCISAPLVNLATARVTYRFNGQQVAVREGVTLTFIYGDHLGSASLTADASGTKVSEMRYYPFGETRYSSGNTATPKRFTSQEEQVGIGLYDYGARFYDPAIGRFISADSVVPRPGDPQSLNRYAYARNSPVTRVDLGGHADTCNSALYSCGNSDPVDPYYTTPSPGMVAGVTHGTPYPYLNAVSFPNGYLGMDVAATKWIRAHPYYNPYTDLNAVTTNWMGEKVQETGFDYINQALIQLLIDHGRTEEAQRLSGAKAALIQASAGVAGTGIIVFGQLLSTGWRPAVVYGMLQENRATPNHASLMQEEVLNLASTGEYSEFHLNQKLSTSTNGKVLSGLQPDILALTVDGRYVVVEVQSTSQSLSSQQAKINNMVQLISDQGYNASGYVIAQP
jgi:RHS repeat-associated protein